MYECMSTQVHRLITPPPVPTDEVPLGGPVLRKRIWLIVKQIDASDVVGQRVEPHIHDVFLIEAVGDGNAPVERCAAD
jgi:hypothetical protein